MGWIYLLSAILLEVSGTMSMKLSEGLTKTIPSILIFVFYGLSLSLLTLALKSIPVSIAYAIWSGIGTALIAVIGFTFFQESFSTVKWLGIGLIIIGVVLINLKGTTH
ncbi:MAG: hypothetical protein CME68_03920 [Halobacteriovoraceae bacterium]|nr:hypothetical protein [Halobacteriovoraceae bacterium]|tara:strand:+ start:357 stop:680 length:324 start_codon:yes stop_codon:yes gene_type:complete